MNRTLIAVVAFATWSVGMFAIGWAWRGDRAAGAEAKLQASTSAAAVEQIAQVRAIEHQQADTLATIGEKHEEDRAAAEVVTAAVVADLRAGNLQLRRQWAACETNRVSESGAGAAERNALADLRAKDQGDLVRIGRDAHDQVEACQAVISANQKH